MNTFNKTLFNCSNPYTGIKVNNFKFTMIKSLGLKVIKFIKCVSDNHLKKVGRARRL